MCCLKETTDPRRKLFRGRVKTKLLIVIVLKRISPSLMENRTAVMCQHDMSHSWSVCLCVFLFKSCRDREEGGKGKEGVGINIPVHLRLHHFVSQHQDPKVRIKLSAVCLKRTCVSSGHIYDYQLFIFNKYNQDF